MSEEEEDRAEMPSYPRHDDKEHGGAGGADSRRDQKRGQKDLANHSRRGAYQKRTDLIDIAGPSAWLHHEATADLKLRREAQNDLQLMKKHSRSKKKRDVNRKPVRIRGGVFGGIIERVKSEGRMPAGARAERRAQNLMAARDVLPWGTWPVRLKNHDGHSCYSLANESGNGFGGVGVQVVGRSCLSVTEDAIHDDLLRSPPPLTADGVGAASAAEAVHEATVKRLLPGDHGSWVEVPQATAINGDETRSVCWSGRAMCEAAASSAEDVAAADRNATVNSNYDVAATAIASVAPSTTPLRQQEGGAKTKRLEPGWYGGSVELDEPLTREETLGQVCSQTAASFTNVEVDESASAKAEPAAASSSYASTSRGQGRPLRCLQSFTSTSKEREGGGRREGNGCTCNSEAVGGGVVGGCVGGGCQDRGGGGSGGDFRQGWTVSEPAKEAVRRVWARAWRRRNDACHPRCVSSTSATSRNGSAGADGKAAWDDDDDSTTTRDEERGAGEGNPTPSPAQPLPKETLDPVLLSCLGRECEGIIDAALHVVLSERLLHLRSESSTSSSTEASTAAATKENSGRTPRDAHVPPPLASWEDVLRVMGDCSSVARARETNPVASVANSGSLDVEVDGRETGNSTGGRSQDSLPVASGIHQGVSGEARGSGKGGRVGVERSVWGRGDDSDGAVIVVNERLPGLPLNDAVLTRAYNRLLLYLHEN